MEPSSNEKPKTYRGPDDADLWEPRYLLLETTDETELKHGFNIEVADRSPDRRKRWTELCGKTELRLTLTAEDAN